MKKRICLILICFIILILFVSLLIWKFGDKSSLKNGKLQIVTTIYPEYDFTKHIVGDKADVIRLIGAGVEVHTYEPSVRDMKKISDSNMFIYTGEAMEPWAKTIISSLNDSVKIVNCSNNIDLIESDEFMDEYSVLSKEYLEHDHDEHIHEYDGHIWMNPQNAIIMIDTILEQIVSLDPSNEVYYRENAEKYKTEILKLDTEIEEKLKENNIEVLVFGGEFAYSYFCQRYNLDVVSCYDACGEGSEPSVSKIKKVIDFINLNNIPKVYYEELSEGTVAQMLAEETNAKAVVFNTIHNVSKEEIEANANYVSIMRNNLEKICK